MSHGVGVAGEHAGGAHRLWEMAAQKIQAELAPNRPEGMCARGPSMRSANTVSMIAWHTEALDDPLEFAHPGCAGAARTGWRRRFRELPPTQAVSVTGGWWS